MTREEAKSIVRGITDKIEATTDIDDWAEFWGFTRDDYEEFLEMPIKLLEQEPFEDAISRQAAIDAINKIHPVDTDYDCTLYDKIDVMYVLKDLPPVNRQNCDKCEVGNPCLYCKHEFEPQESEDKE